MLVIFDLDGTLTPQRPSSTAPFKRELLSGVRAKCGKLVAEGHTLAIATNQGGLRKGLTEKEVRDILGWVVEELLISQARVASGRNPDMKKPAPGMLLKLMDEFNAAPADTLFVGDAESDMLAARAAGVGFIYARKFFS